jgi:hypothetical protein
MASQKEIEEYYQKAHAVDVSGNPFSGQGALQPVDTFWRNCVVAVIAIIGFCAVAFVGFHFYALHQMRRSIEEIQRSAYELVPGIYRK